MKNPWLKLPIEYVRCLAYGHAWSHPAGWTGWEASKTEDPSVYTVRSFHPRRCYNGCGATQKTSLRVRVSLRGNVVEVLSSRSRVTWKQLHHLKGEPRPTRSEFRLEFLSRQLVDAVRASGVKMRRMDAAANISLMMTKRHSKNLVRMDVQHPPLTQVPRIP